MDSQQAVVDQIIRNLAFDIEAVPKNKSIQASDISQSTPLNVQIKVRKKDEILEYHDVSWNADSKTIRKVRLVNSDRTIMSFDVFMEAEFEKKPSRKLHKHVIDMLKPGICLGDVDHEKHPYMPISSYSANITEPTQATKSDGTFKQTFTLSKTVCQDKSVSTQQKAPKRLFGKCKPGGCLDPPFSDDKYSYKPSTGSGPKREEEEVLDENNVESDVYKKPILIHDDKTQNNGRHSSICDSGLFKKKRRCSDKSTNTKLPDKTDSIVEIYHGESATNSTTTRSNSIITYPPKTQCISRISDDKTARSRGSSEDKPRNSFNDHSEPCFIRPKGVDRIKEKNTLDPSDYPRHESSDVTKLRHSVIESFKMPVPLPIPIPIPIISNTRKSEVIDSIDTILTTQGENATVTELPEQGSQKELQEKTNLKDAANPQPLREEAATGGNDDIPVTSSKLEEWDKSMDKSKLQPFEDVDSENKIEDTGFDTKNEEESLMPLPIPIPVPFNSSDSAAMDSKTNNENMKTSDINLSQSKQSVDTKTTPPIIKDIRLNDSKDIQKKIDPENRSIENESTLNVTPILPYSDIEADEIPEDYLRTRPDLSDPESYTENQENDTANQESDTDKEEGDIGNKDSDTVTIPLIIIKEKKQYSRVEEITESNDKPTQQNDIKDEDTSGIKDKEDENSNVYEIPIDAITEPLNDGPKIDERKDSQRISRSKLPILQKSMSILSRSRTSTASKISIQIYTDKAGERGTIPLSDKEYVGEITKPNNDGNFDSYTKDQARFTNEENTNFVTAPVIIDNTELSSKSVKLKEVAGIIHILGQPMNIDRDYDPSGIQFTTQESDGEEETNSTVSRELILTQSVIYDTDEFIPAGSIQKQTEKIPLSEKQVDTRLSSIQSTSTLKSAMKKDLMSVDFGFHTYLNDKNERILRTFDVANSPKRFSNDSVTLLKTQIRISSNEIRIPVDSEHDMSIKFKKSNANQRVSISESGCVNDIDNSRVIKQRSPALSSHAEIRSSETKVEESIDTTLESNTMDDHFTDYYEKELVPLQLIIKNLRSEIDFLAAQQLVFKEKLFSSNNAPFTQNKSKLPRLVHSNKKCYGCVRK